MSTLVRSMVWRLGDVNGDGLVRSLSVHARRFAKPSSCAKSLMGRRRIERKTMAWISLTSHDMALFVDLDNDGDQDLALLASGSLDSA